jgi:ribonuclease P protein component
MLPKEKRISRKIFNEIIKNPLNRPFFNNSSHFSLRITVIDESKSLAAVSVSKKIARKAVERNLIRRRVYSALKGIIPNLKPGLYLVVAKAGAREIKGEKLRAELKELFSKYLV